MPALWRRSLAALASAVVLISACGGAASQPPLSAAPPSDTSAPAPTPSPYAADTQFTSPLYGYSTVIGAGWVVIPAASKWDGKSVVGHDDPIVDQLLPPAMTGRCEKVYQCAPIYWAYSSPTSDSLDALSLGNDVGDARDHPCPPTPETSEAVTIDGTAAVLKSKHCEPVTGLLNLTAIAVRNGVGYFFYSQDAAREPVVERLDKSEFLSFLAGVNLPD